MLKKIVQSEGGERRNNQIGGDILVLPAREEVKLIQLQVMFRATSQGKHIQRYDKNYVKRKEIGRHLDGYYS